MKKATAKKDGNLSSKAKLSGRVKRQSRTNFIITSSSQENTKEENKEPIPLRLLNKPTNEAEYVEIERALDKLIDRVRDDEDHELTTIMKIIGNNLEEYDDEQNPPIGANVSDIEMIRYLMKSRNLNQKGIAHIFGGQANASHFLNGKRELSKSQILKIKKEFGISADFFLR